MNWDCKKEFFQCQNENKGLASLKRPNKLFLHFMRVKKSVVYSQGGKIVLVFDFQLRQRWRNRNDFFFLTYQRFMYSLKRKPWQENWIFNVSTLTSEVVHLFWCSRSTQRLCLHLSHKYKTYACTNEFVSQLQTNNGDICMWCWQKWSVYMLDFVENYPS